MDECKELKWSGFLSVGLPIAHIKHKTHKAAIREVARDWQVWKDSVIRARLEKKCKQKSKSKSKNRNLKKALKSICPYA